jgi:hypothetical protein
LDVKVTSEIPVGTFNANLTGVHAVRVCLTCAGEIKIGDLGLATLIPLRWEESEQDPPPEVVTMQKVRG